MKDVNVYSAVRWSAVAKYGAQAVDFVTSIIVARLVMPEAYGLMSMALVLIGFLSILQSLGFGPAIIQRKTISQALLSTLFIANLVLSLAMVVVVAGAAPLFGWIYRDQRVTWVMLALTVQFVLNSFGLVPNALLTRKMRFGALAAVDIAAALVRLVVAIGLAYRGWEVWALVWSSAISAAAQSLCLWIAAHWRPRLWFRYKHLRNVIGFSSGITGVSVLAYLGWSSGNFIIGALLGAAALGPFSIACRLMFFPKEAIGDVVLRVFFPVFSRCQDNHQELGSVFLKVMEAIALVAFPCVFGLVAVAPTMIDWLLGPKWNEAVPVMYGLTGIALVSLVLPVANHLYMAKGRTGPLFGWAVARFLAMVAATAVGCYWGTPGVAIAWSVATVLTGLPNLSSALSFVQGLRSIHLAQRLFPYILSAAFMCASVVVLAAFLREAQVPSRTTVLLSVAAGVVIYAILITATRPASVLLLLRLLWMPAGDNRQPQVSL